MNKSKNISQRFIEELGDQELWSTIHNCAPLVQASGWTAKRYYGKFSDNKLSFPAFVSIKDNVGVMYIPITKTKQLAGEALERHLKDDEYIGDLDSRRRPYELKIADFYKKFTEEYFDTVSNEICRNDLIELRDTIWEYNALVFFSTGFDRDTVDSVLGRLNKSVSDEFWNRAGKPPTPSFERRHGWYLAERSGATSEKIASECQYFFAVYDHVPQLGEINSLVKKSYGIYVDGGADLVRKEKEDLNKLVASHERWIASLSDTEASVARFIEMVIELRDERKDYLLMMTTISFRAAWSMLRKAGFPISLAGYLNYDEVLKGEDYVKKHFKDIISRKEGFDVYCSYDGSHEVEYGNVDANRSAIEASRQKGGIDRSDSTDIKGQIGYSGKVVGIVRKVLNIGTDAGKFKDGEILVAGMTRPEYVPLMKKASAIITDEGGITCHAAIISRELKKPCIIGTKIATKVLKDGDMVEVDAENGVVRIIKS